MSLSMSMSFAFPDMSFSMSMSFDYSDGKRLLDEEEMFDLEVEEIIEFGRHHALLRRQE
jgi:hypothetical protein